LDAGFSIYLESPVHALSKCQQPATLYQADSSGITIAGYDPGMWGVLQMEGRKQKFRTVGEGEGARRKAKKLVQRLSEMEKIAASPEDRFLSWHRSGDPLPLDRAIRDHARAAKHTVAASTAERYGQFAERVVARLGDVDLRYLQKEDIGRLVRAECADDRAKDPTINACVLLRGLMQTPSPPKRDAM
jgi:hypothetical protein